ncbi:MAG: type II secretion system protein GspG [Planctomycetia bacterium]|nr:type II secretion system protein GspG [Planctomycetia bacterium]
MSRAWKQVKQYERWVLIGIVVLLLATFSVTGASQGCTRKGPGRGEDLGGTFQVAPGQSRSVSHEDFVAVFRRYEALYARVLGPSIRFAGEMLEDRNSRKLLGTWMHIAQVEAAKAAGYRVSDDEVRDTVRELVSRWAGRGGGFTPERYEQVLEGISRGSQGALNKADFELTVRELLLKDKFLGDLVVTDRYAVDRKEAFDAWKASRERVDLVFAALPAAAFVDVVRPDEQTRSAIAAQGLALQKAVDAVRDVRRHNATLATWREKHGAWPADEAEFLSKEPGKALGAKLPNDPWGAPFVYAKVGDAGVLSSVGPDGKPGTADDVRPEAAKLLDTLANLRRVGDALRTWFREAGAWPDALTELTKAPPSKEGKLPVPAPLLEVSKDGWGGELTWDKATATLRSAGADGKAGTDDDAVAKPSADAVVVPLPAALVPFLAADQVNDAWNRPLAVRFATGRFEASSAGADGVEGNDDDVKDGNSTDVEAFFVSVRRDFAIPRKREFEAAYVVPSLVSDELFGKAWAKLPQFRPTESDAWETFLAQLGSGYRIADGEGADAPDVDPKDPVKGYGADLRRQLIEQKVIPAGTVGWPVPSADAFGDQKAAPASNTPGLPDPGVNKLYKTYLDRGWRYVALRDQFFAKLLDAMLKTARDKEAEYQAWIAGGSKGVGPDRGPTTFAAQLAAWQEFQPSEADRAAGAQFLTLYSTPAPLERQAIEALPVLGYPALSSYLDPLKDGDYDVTPKTLFGGPALVAVRSVKRHNERDAELAEVRGKPEFWDRYLDTRALDRAARELDKVRTALLPPPADPKAPAPTAADGAAKVKAFQDAVDAAVAARKLPVVMDRTGPFVGATSLGQRAPKAPASATPAEKDALARRAYVRGMGYSAVRQIDGSKSTEVGTVGRFVLRDTPRLGVEAPTKAAYLVVVAGQSDPGPEEFHGKAFVEWVRQEAYDQTPEWQPARGIQMHDRKGRLLRLLYGLYDDWERVKVDYKIATNEDLVVPKDAGAAR